MRPVQSLALGLCALAACRDQGPGALGPIALTFCADSLPVWFAVRNADSAWATKVPDVAGTYSFTPSSRVAVAFVHRTSLYASGGFITTVWYTTADELRARAQSTCRPQVGTARATGSVAGISGGGRAGQITMGPSTVSVSGSAAVSFRLNKLPPRLLDLVAIRSTFSNPDLVIVRHQLAVTDSTTIPILDFGASEAAALDTRTIAFSGVDPSTEAMSSGYRFESVNGTVAAFGLTGSGTLPLPLIPASVTGQGDLHHVFLSAARRCAAPTCASGQARYAEKYFASPAPQTLTPASAISATTITQAASAPYARFRVQLASQTDYPDGIVVQLTQTPPTLVARYLNLKMHVTAGHLGALPAAWDVTTPDFSGVPGWDNTWGPGSNRPTSISVLVFGGRPALVIGGAAKDGDALMSAQFLTTLTTQ